MGRVKIEVGKRYKCKHEDRFSTGMQIRGYFTIVHRDGLSNDCSGTLNYLGVSDSGFMILFDCYGVDEHFVCGGCWWELDTSASYEPKWKALESL